LKERLTNAEHNVSDLQSKLDLVKENLGNDIHDLKKEFYNFKVRLLNYSFGIISI
jgi:hypothetical protein